jgi:hypothetical protein
MKNILLLLIFLISGISHASDTPNMIELKNSDLIMACKHHMSDSSYHIFSFKNNRVELFAGDPKDNSWPIWLKGILSYPQYDSENETYQFSLKPFPDITLSVRKKTVTYKNRITGEVSIKKCIDVTKKYTQKSLK